MQTVASSIDFLRHPSNFDLPDISMLTADLDQTEFLKHCRDGSVTQHEMRTFLVQHYHYARHFTRYLCALIANMASALSA